MIVKKYYSYTIYFNIEDDDMVCVVDSNKTINVDKVKKMIISKLISELDDYDEYDDKMFACNDVINNIVRENNWILEDISQENELKILKNKNFDIEIMDSDINI